MDKNALVDTVLPETEGGTTMCSSEAGHSTRWLCSSWAQTSGRVDVYTSWKRRRRNKFSSICDDWRWRCTWQKTNLLAAATAATCGQGSDCQNNAHSVTIILKVVKNYISLRKCFFRLLRQVLSCLQSSRDSSETSSKDKGKQETTHKVAMKNDESDDKDAEIMRLFEERRKLPKE